jgi:hypothetical protein
VLKKAQYWKEFSAATQVEAERVAAAWWAEQRGFDKICDWTLPAPSSDATGQWTVTIIYKMADRANTTVH